MRKILLSTTAMVVLSVGAAQAQSLAERVITRLQAEGYESIEVTNGLTQIKVEAIRNGRKLEVIYDAVTGAILEQEVEPVNEDDDYAPGVGIENDARDFLDDDDDEDDDDEDDGDEDEGDDDNGDDDNGDDDSDDDNGDNDDDD